MAAALSIPEEDLRALIDSELLAAVGGPWREIGGIQVLDRWGMSDGIIPSRESDAARREAACISGFAYLSLAPARSGEPPKVVLGGCGEGTVPGTAPVEAFLGGWAASKGLVRPYGDPVRGVRRRLFGVGIVYMVSHLKPERIARSRAAFGLHCGGLVRSAHGGGPPTGPAVLSLPVSGRGPQQMQ